MSKVIGIVDKVLLVQNPSTVDPFIVKSLPKCSQINRERQTIIPQGVPFMVRLLKYYVSDDTVFLHLEHISGGKLWSQLSQYRPPVAEKGMEFPGCSSPHHKTIKLKNSYTAPSLSIICNDASTFAPVCKEDCQREAKNKVSRECNTVLIDLQTRTGQGVSDKLLCHKNGENQQNEYANRARIWQGSNSTSKTNLLLNGLSQSTERTNFQVAHLEHNDSVTFDLSLVSDGDLIHRGKIMNHTLASNVGNLMQKGPRHGKTQLISQDKLLQSLNNFSETNGSSKSLNPKSRTCQIQTDLDLSNGKVSLGNEESQQGASPVRSPVRATRLNLKVGTRPGRIGSYQITVNPLDTIDSQSQVDGFVDSSNLVIVGSSAALPARNTTVTVLEKGQSEQKTSVSVLSSVQQANGHPLLPPNVVETQMKLLRLKDRSPEEMLNCKASHAKLDYQCKNSDQVLVSETCDHQDQDSRTLSGNGPFCRVESSRSLSRRSGSLDLCKTEEGLPSPLCHPNAKPSIRSQSFSGLSEEQIRIWVAEMVLALESLHQQGIVCLDLNPRNILVDSAGHICLTYFGQWSEVEVQCNPKAIEEMYCAPEVGGVGEVTEACDWWSLGALLFELLTGTTLSQCYPSKIHPHTQIRLPDHLSPAAVSLLQQLLQWDYRCRLGSGENGTQEIKSHSFFSSVRWSKLNGYR
ncbi:ribosomal protein S6 kinase-like 1 isoform X2 [Narcine bancroftii]